MKCPIIASKRGLSISLSVASLLLNCYTVANANGAGRVVHGTTQNIYGNHAGMSTLSFTLPLRNRASLAALLNGLYDPSSPNFHRFLTPPEFRACFSPKQDDVDRVIAYAKSQGMVVEGSNANRTIVNVLTNANTAERIFGIRPGSLKTVNSNNREMILHALPQQIASRITGIVGFDGANRWHSHAQAVLPQMTQFLQPYQIGSGPSGGLTPNDIKAAYGLNLTTRTGSGQTIALFELDGYLPSDIAAYESAYGLPAATVQPVLMDGFSGAAGKESAEVTLDIELQLAVSPGAKILVYEGPNTDSAVINLYDKIASDDIAKQVSTSWGLSETTASSDVIRSENTAFQQMAAQGQSMFAASGDEGAYDDGKTVSVDDPASQPFVTGVGGTQLFVHTDRSYASETTWNHGSPSRGAGGGGRSIIWSKPAYQAGLGASTTMRDVPDVALNADQFTAYSIMLNGSWVLYGGTSCAAPIWAAFTALVNEQRSDYQASPLGQANPALYQIAQSASYSSDFNDINDGSNNLVYTATTGYDDATGWGSFKGTALINDLAPLPALSMSGAVVVSPRRGAVVIRWNTNRPSDATVHLGEASNTLTFTNTSPRLTTEHIVCFYGLRRDRTYYFNVTSLAGSETTGSGIAAFTTF